MREPVLVVAACLLLGTPAIAGSFGVTLSASGGTGDACYPPYSGEEGFNSGNLSNSYRLSYTGSGVGFDNATGCQNSGVVGNVSATGSASLGVLKLSAAASENVNDGIGGGASITVGWSDTFTAVTSGTFQISVYFNATLGDSPTCSSNGPSASINYDVNEYGPFEQEDISDWHLTDCSGFVAPYYTYGSTTVVSPNMVTMDAYLNAGSSFTVAGSLQGNTNTPGGENASAFVDASDTGIVDVVGLGNATYASASGTVYDATDVPEPSTWLLIIGGIAALGTRIRRGAGIMIE